jgi:ABC-type transport system substrate-binding protein
MAQKVLRVGILTRISTLNPREAWELVSTIAVTQIFETPYSLLKAEGGAQPLLFDPLVAEGPGVFAARVRPGIVFSDGTPLTAALAAQSLARVDALKEQASVSSRDDRVVFTLKAPNPRFDLALTLVQCSIVLEKGGQLLGTGPYVPAPGATLDAMRLVRNERHRTSAPIEEIVFKVYPPNADGKPEQLMAALAAGEVDFTNMLSRTDATALGGVRKVFQPSNSTAILYVNVERPELKDARVRRALALAIDRLALAEVSYTNALAFAASGLLPPLMGPFRDELGFDLAKAQALLAQAPVKPSRLSLLRVWAPRPYLPNPQPVADMVVKQLAALGIEVKVNVPRASEDFFKSCERGDYDLVLAGWIADTPDPADFLEANLKSDRVQSSASLPCANRSRLRSREMDAALQRFREDPSPANRAAILKILNDEAPLVPLLYGPAVVITTWKVKNLEVSPMGVAYFSSADLDA